MELDEALATAITQHWRQSRSTGDTRPSVERPGVRVHTFKSVRALSCWADEGHGCERSHKTGTRMRPRRRATAAETNAAEHLVVD